MALENHPIKFQISQIQDQKNILRYYYDDSDIEDEDDQIINQLNICFTIELIVDEQKINPSIQTQFKKKQNLDNNIIFNYKYKDLAYNSLIAITIWSAHKKYDEKKPLGSTTISLFDEQFRLRQGKYHLYIWPNTLPDTSYKSTTPGLISDESLQQINQSLKKTSEMKQRLKKKKNIENEIFFDNCDNIQINKYYIYQKIPAAFLEIVFHQFNTIVLYQDPQYIKEYEDNSLFSQQINTLRKRKTQNIQENTFQNCIIVYDFDFQYQKEDLVQEQQKLILREVENPQELMPNKQELQTIENSIKTPILGEISNEEKHLFYRYRYNLLQNGEALIKFLHSINWNQEKEEKEAIKLLKEWIPCEFEDALHLLSSSFCANDIYNKKKKPVKSMILVRKYACNILDKCSDQKISSFLLQLTQALKYEPFSLQDSHLVQLLIKKSGKSTEIATQLYWYIQVECQSSNNNSNQINSQSESYRLNKTNQKVLDWYEEVFKHMKDNLQTNNKDMYQILIQQQNFRNKLKDLVQSLKGKERQLQIEMIKEKLSQEEFKQPKFEKHPFCLNPKYILLEAVPQLSSVFKSAMAPIKLGFKALDTETNTNIIVELIYKNGDDLRQDQLIMQIFNLMDDLLKGVKQDFKLTPYKVLACSKSDGFVEFVPQSTTIQDILKNDTILGYFKKVMSDPKSPLYEEFREQNEIYTEKNIEQMIQQQLNIPNGINNSKLMNNYMLSCAGYCVITYFLGIGDRHLENLMIDNTGKFFHIDFGFILGEDPKPYPPPIKLCKQMVEAMGGVQSLIYQEFKKKCVNAYIYLRKYAKLIVNLFHLMIDSGIKDMSFSALEKMADKFNLSSSDYDAELHFLNILDQSVNALFPIIFDIMHQWSSYWKN